MRVAVLVTNYIVAGLLVLALTNVAGTEDPGTTILGLLLLAPAVILSLIYAHRSKED